MTELNLMQIERLLKKKRTKLNLLLKRRDVILRQLAAVEANMQDIGGDVAKPRRAPRVRLQNERTLHEVVIEILEAEKSGLELGKLSESVLATGYKTTSANFPNTVYQCLYHSPEIERNVETNCYHLKAKPAPRRKKATE